jgi:regulator of replication initiation timing
MDTDAVLDDCVRKLAEAKDHVATYGAAMEIQIQENVELRRQNEQLRERVSHLEALLAKLAAIVDEFHALVIGFSAH